jgi:signal transduction histidine kinase
LAERSHDLRSLVAGIQSATATLTRYREVLSADEQRLLESALLAEIGRLQRTVGTSASSDAFTMRSVFGAVITAERARGAVISATLPDVETRGGADALAALLQNLLTNARRHAPGAAVTISGTVADGWARVVVADDGPGLPIEERRRVSRLCDPGAPDSGPDRGVVGAAQPERLEPTFVAGRRGGLGLAICARLAYEHGARLRVLETASGTAFELAMQVVGGGGLPSPRTAVFGHGGGW